MKGIKVKKILLVQQKMSDLSRLKIKVLLPNNKRLILIVEVEKQVWELNKRLVLKMNVNKWWAQKKDETVIKRVTVRKT